MKAFLGVLVAAQLLTTPAAICNATVTEEPMICAEIVGDSEEIQPRVEEFVWFFRTLDNGKRQKRLWSLTYQYWATDWIDCD